MLLFWGPVTNSAVHPKNTLGFHRYLAYYHNRHFQVTVHNICYKTSNVNWRKQLASVLTITHDYYVLLPNLPSLSRVSQSIFSPQPRQSSPKNLPCMVLIQYCDMLLLGAVHRIPQSNKHTT